MRVQRAAVRCEADAGQTANSFREPPLEISVERAAFRPLSRNRYQTEQPCGTAEQKIEVVPRLCRPLSKDGGLFFVLRVTSFH